VAGDADGRQDHNLNTATGRRAAQGITEAGEARAVVEWIPFARRRWRFIEHYGFDAYASPHWSAYTSDGVIPFVEFVRAEAEMDERSAAAGRLQLAEGVALGAAIALVGSDDPSVRRALQGLERIANPTLNLGKSDGRRIQGR
jgi:hypothetical protein